MSNELKHADVGSGLTEAEYDSVTAHQFASQATGDIMYASSTSQLTRLAKGSDNDVLRLASGIPDWQATSFITSLGTIATGVWEGTDVGVAHGGTGVSTLAANSLLTGNGTSAIVAEAALTFDGTTLDVQNTTDAASNLVGVFRAGNRSTAVDDDDGHLDFTLDDSLGAQNKVASFLWRASDVLSSRVWGEVVLATYLNESAGPTLIFGVDSGGNRHFDFQTSSGTTVMKLDTKLTLNADLEFTGPQTISTSSGNLTIGAATGADVLIGDNETILYVDGGTGTIGIGGAAGDWALLSTRRNFTAQAAVNFAAYTLTGNAGSDISTLRMGMAMQEANSGTHPVVAGLHLLAPTVTNGGGSEAVTSLATLYIVGAPTAGTAPANGPYALFVDAGASRFDGNVSIENTGAQATLTIDSSDTTSESSALILNADRPSDNGYSGVVRFSSADTAFAEIVGYRGAADNAGYLAFRTANSGSVVTKLILDEAGNLDLQGNSNWGLLNVGASGSDWDSTSLRNAADYFGANAKGMVIGHTAQVTAGGLAELQVIGTEQNTDSSMLLGLWSTTNSEQPIFQFVKSGSGSIGGYTTVANGELLGAHKWFAADGGDISTQVARFGAVVDDAGGPATSDIGAAFTWALSDGAGTDNIAEKMRLTAAGNLISGSNDGGSLGVSGTAWSDLFLADGGVINWNAGELTLTQTNTVLAFAGGTFNPTGGMDAVGNAGSSLAADAWTMSSANVNTMKIETTGASNHALFDMHIPASGSGLLQIRLFQGVGNGDANNMRYTLGYNAGSAIFQIESQDIDGSSTAGDVLRISDGTNDVRFIGGISTDDSTPPTSGILVGGGDIDLITTSASVGGELRQVYDIANNAGGFGSIRKTIRQASLTHDTATTVFTITNTDESGNVDAGAYVCHIKAIIRHGGDNNAAGGGPTTRYWEGTFSKSIDYGGTASVSAVAEAASTAISAVNESSRGFASPYVVVTTTSANAYTTAVQFTLTLSGTNVTTGKVVVSAEVIWENFRHSPAIA